MTYVYVKEQCLQLLNSIYQIFKSYIAVMGTSGHVFFSLSMENIMQCWHGKDGMYLNLSLISIVFPYALVSVVICNLPLSTLSSYKMLTLPYVIDSLRVISPCLADFTQDWNQHFFVTIQEEELITCVSNAQPHACPPDAVTKTQKTSSILFLSTNISMSCSIVLHNSQKVPI